MKNIRIFAVWIIIGVALLVSPQLLAQDEVEDDDVCAIISNSEFDLAFYVGQGDVFFAQKSYTQAIAMYTCAIERDPTYIPAHVHRGFAYATQGNDPLALEDYERALEIDPTSVAAYNNRGVLYTQQGRFRLALTDFDLAIALDPSDAVVYNNRGTVHAIEGRYDMALADFEQAIALDPEFAEPHASLGMVYSAMAAASYDRYRDILDNDQARLPSGEADVVLLALDDSRETGYFSIWLPLLTPAR